MQGLNSPSSEARVMAAIALGAKRDDIKAFLEAAAVNNEMQGMNSPSSEARVMAAIALRSKA